MLFRSEQLFKKYMCYCSTAGGDLQKSISASTTKVPQLQSDIEAAEAQLEDLRAQNTKLSQEVAKLESDMAENKAAREEATALREKEKADFEKEEADLVTGIDQLDRAYNLLAAIGGDQTVSGDTDSAQLMAGGASERAGFKGVDFLSKTSNVQKRNLGALDEDMKAALRAASVFLSGAQRSKLHSFLQAPFTGNYNAQSGEIVGVIKNMKDTFEANLESTRANEEKKQKEYDEMMEIKTAEYDEMEELFDSDVTETDDDSEKEEDDDDDPDEEEEEEDAQQRVDERADDVATELQPSAEDDARAASSPPRRHDGPGDMAASLTPIHPAFRPEEEHAPSSSDPLVVGQKRRLLGSLASDDEGEDAGPAKRTRANLSDRKSVV